jgi:hypothetical protein
MAASEIEKLERLVRENPKGRQFAILADAYRKDGQFQRALEVLTPGLEVHPEYVSARVVLGRVLMAMGDSVKAREAFTQVVTLDPESVIALKALADLAEEQGDGTEALQRASQLLTVDPGNEEAQKQVERLSTKVAVPAEVRLSGIVPMEMEEIAEIQAPLVAVDPAPEPTAAPFEAVKPPVVKTVEIPAITVQSNAPSFTASPAPLEQAPEPLPLMPLSEEAQTEQVASSVVPMAALEPTAFEGSETASATTERLAGIDPVGLSAAEVASIGAASGFEPTSDAGDTSNIPRTSLTGLESISGDVIDRGAAEATDDGMGLEREQEIELGGAGVNEFQVASDSDSLQRRSGANEFQVSSDADLLDASHAEGADPLETGGSDLAFIEPEPEVIARASRAVPAPQAPVFTPAPLPPEEPEPAVAEPEPVVTEAMAELYAAQGHLAEALAVYRQLAEREPGELRFAEKVVELEMFVGGAETPMPVERSAPVTMAPPPMAAPAPLVGAPASREVWDARSTGGKPVGSWLTEIFAQALPKEEVAAAEFAVEPEAAAPAAPPLMEPPLDEALELIEAEAGPVADASVPPPQGQPTRPASGGFSLDTVFGDERPGAPVAKSGSFDDFFGAPTVPQPAQPPVAPPSASSIRSTRTSAPTPQAEDDLSSFQDWLKGLKK